MRVHTHTHIYICIYDMKFKELYLYVINNIKNKRN